jgi:hypothetical protein
MERAFTNAIISTHDSAFEGTWHLTTRAWKFVNEGYSGYVDMQTLKVPRSYYATEDFIVTLGDTENSEFIGKVRNVSIDFPREQITRVGTAQIINTKLKFETYVFGTISSSNTQVECRMYSSNRRRLICKSVETTIGLKHPGNIEYQEFIKY